MSINTIITLYELNILLFYCSSHPNIGYFVLCLLWLGQENIFPISSLSDLLQVLIPLLGKSIWKWHCNVQRTEDQQLIHLQDTLVWSNGYNLHLFTQPLIATTLRLWLNATSKLVCHVNQSGPHKLSCNTNCHTTTSSINDEYYGPH